MTFICFNMILLFLVLPCRTINNNVALHVRARNMMVINLHVGRIITREIIIENFNNLFRFNRLFLNTYKVFRISMRLRTFLISTRAWIKRNLTHFLFTNYRRLLNATRRFGDFFVMVLPVMRNTNVSTTFRYLNVLILHNGNVMNLRRWVTNFSVFFFHGVFLYLFRRFIYAILHVRLDGSTRDHWRGCQGGFFRICIYFVYSRDWGGGLMFRTATSWGFSRWKYQ